MEDNRKIRRHRIFKGATIVSAGGSLSTRCIVRNISPSGACLDLESTVAVPGEFELVFDDRSKASACKVVWRSPTRVGVSFEVEADDTSHATSIVMPSRMPSAPLITL